MYRRAMVSTSRRRSSSRSGLELGPLVACTGAGVDVLQTKKSCWLKKSLNKLQLTLYTVVRITIVAPMTEMAKLYKTQKPTSSNSAAGCRQQHCFHLQCLMKSPEAVAVAMAGLALLFDRWQGAPVAVKIMQTLGSVGVDDTVESFLQEVKVALRARVLISALRTAASDACILIQNRRCPINGLANASLCQIIPCNARSACNGHSEAMQRFRSICDHSDGRALYALT